MGLGCDLVDVGAKAYHDGAKDLESFARAMKQQFGRDLDPEVLNAAFSKASARYRASASEIEGIKTAIALELQKARRSGLAETVTALRRAGMLTGIRTQVRNAVGNTASAVFDEISRIPGSIMDMALARFTGRRTMLGPDPAAIKDSIFSAVTKGMKDSWNVIKTGATPEELAKYDIPRELNAYFKGVELKPINGYVNFVNRVQSAADKPFREYAFMRSMLEQSKIAARADGLVGDAFKTRVEQLASAPTDAMRLQAIADSEEAVFANSNKLADGMRSLAQKGGTAGTFALDTIVPFKQVPTNVVGRTLEATPAGAVKATLQALIHKIPDAATQKAISKAFGRSATGSVMLYLGYKLAENGIITGGRSAGPGVAGREQAAGRPPGSILVNGTYYQLGDTPPGTLLAVGAAVFHDAKEGKHPPAPMTAGVKEMGKTLLGMPMLQGASDLVEGLKNPQVEGGPAARFVRGVAGSVIPTAVADYAAAGDPNVRAVSSPLDAVKNRIPGQRETLPLKRDALGQPIERTSLVNPYQGPHSRESDPVVRELVRLRVPIQPAAAGKDAAKKTFDKDEAAHQDKVRFVGSMVRKALGKVIATSAYGRFTDEVQHDLLLDVNRRVKASISKALEDGVPRAKVEAAADGLIGKILDSYDDEKHAVWAKHAGKLYRKAR